jgi:receptor-interacting serine/threonine-protein kinase 5
MPSRPRYGIVMERMQRTLFSALREGLMMRDRLQICMDIASGLAFLHAEGVIHADLKSPNVLLDKDNHAKLSDFGLAKKVSSCSFRE